MRVPLRLFEIKIFIICRLIVSACALFVHCIIFYSSVRSLQIIYIPPSFRGKMPFLVIFLISLMIAVYHGNLFH